MMSQQLRIVLAGSAALLLAACGGASNAQPSDAVVKQSVLKGLRATVETIAGPHLASRIPDVMKALDAITIAGKQCQQAQGQPGYVCAYRIAMAGKEIAIDERRFTRLGDEWSVSDDPKASTSATLIQLAEGAYRQTVGVRKCESYEGGNFGINNCIGEVLTEAHKSERVKPGEVFAWHLRTPGGEAEGTAKVLTAPQALPRGNLLEAQVEIFVSKGADPFFRNPLEREIAFRGQ